MKQESAHVLALQALAWLAAQDEGLSGFLAQGGLDAAELAARAAEPELLAAVMDHLLAEEARVLDFAASAGVKPETLLAARAALPGGDAPFWT